MIHTGSKSQQIAAAVIPARYDSTRLPGKPLLLIAGKPINAQTDSKALLAQSELPVTETVHNESYKGSFDGLALNFAYFNHSIHINKGVGCSTCHGRVDQMPVVSQTQSLQMEWCLECHRAPERFVRDPKQVFNMEWPQRNSTKGQIDDGRDWVKKLKIQAPNVLTSCSTCHR